MHKARAFFFVCAGIFLLALKVPVVLAGGVNFGWGPVCYTESGIGAITFACNTNSNNTQFGTGAGWPMTASFVLDAPMAGFSSVEIDIAGYSDLPALPDWWKVGQSPDCRASKMSLAADFSLVATETCVNWYPGSSDFEAVVSQQSITELNRVFISAVVYYNDPLLDLQAGIEYYAGKITILNGKTVGTNACADCSAGMKWNLSGITVSGEDGAVYLHYPVGNQTLCWNNPHSMPGYEWYCNAVVPARHPTWGQIKSLYR
jgi:hypothetical protein